MTKQEWKKAYQEIRMNSSDLKPIHIHALRARFFGRMNDAIYWWKTQPLQIIRSSEDFHYQQELVTLVYQDR